MKEEILLSLINQTKVFSHMEIAQDILGWDSEECWRYANFTCDDMQYAGLADEQYLYDYERVLIAISEDWTTNGCGQTLSEFWERTWSDVQAEPDMQHTIDEGELRYLLATYLDMRFEDGNTAMLMDKAS